MCDHEIDRLRCNLFGGADEIAFVLAVFGIDDDDDFASRDRVDSGLNGGKLSWDGCSLN